MMETLLSFDRDAMVWLNMGNAHTEGWNFFFWMVSQIAVWIPVFLVFLYIIIKDKKQESVYIIAGIILLFVLCDQISSSLLKPLVARPRPSHDPLVMQLLSYVNDYHGGAFGFPSSHAANSFGFATFSVLLFRDKLYTLCAMLWAAICAYSRIYLGVHFPGDILCGTLLGIGIAFLCYWGMNKVMERFPKYVAPQSSYSKQDIRLILFTLVVTLFVIGCSGVKY